MKFVIGDLVRMKTFPHSLGVVYGHEESFPDNICIRWLSIPKFEEGDERKFFWEYLEECSRVGELPPNLYEKVA